MFKIICSLPLFGHSCSIGTVTGIPLSIIVDLFINGRVSPFLVYFGMALIAIGFIGFCISEIVAARKESTVEKQFAHHEAIPTRHSVNSAHRDFWPSIFIHQSSVSKSSHLKPHPTSPTLLPADCKEEESQPLLDTHPRRKWKDSVIKYML